VDAGFDEAVNNALTIINPNLELAAESTSNPERAKFEKINQLMSLFSPSELHHSPGKKNVRKPVSESELKKISQKRAKKLVRVYERKIRKLLAPASVDEEQTIFNQWLNQVNTQLDELKIKQAELAPIIRGIGTINRVWENLNLLAKKGVVPPIAPHPAPFNYCFEFKPPSPIP